MTSFPPLGTIPLLPLGAFLVFAIPISIIDIRSFRIPDILSFPCFGLILLTRLLGRYPGTGGALLCALGSLGMFFCVRLATRGLGMGDVKYAASLGLLCGFPAVLLAFLCAAIFGIAAVLIRRRNRPIPFAPFLSAGVLVAFFILESLGAHP